jgi:hypothetical protein
VAWWKAHEIAYPELWRVALRYLSIPATTASVERLFSLAGAIVSSKRTKLSPEMIEVLATLHSVYA